MDLSNIKNIDSLNIGKENISDILNKTDKKDLINLFDTSVIFLKEKQMLRTIIDTLITKDLFLNKNIYNEKDIILDRIHNAMKNINNFGDIEKSMKYNFFNYILDITAKLSYLYVIFYIIAYFILPCYYKLDNLDIDSILKLYNLLSILPVYIYIVYIIYSNNLLKSIFVKNIDIYISISILILLTVYIILLLNKSKINVKEFLNGVKILQNIFYLQLFSIIWSIVRLFSNVKYNVILDIIYYIILITNIFQILNIIYKEYLILRNKYKYKYEKYNHYLDYVKYIIYICMIYIIYESNLDITDGIFSNIIKNRNILGYI